MEKTVRMSLLFDFYGPLLTKRQQEMFIMYFHEDLSLAEAGEQLTVSRQAVYDILKRSEIIMEDFEKKLGLLAKHRKRRELFAQMSGCLKSLGALGCKQEHLERMEALISEMKNIG